MKEFTVYLDEELHKKLTVEAERTGLKKAELVRTALRLAIDGENAIAYKAKKSKKFFRLKEARKYVEELLTKQPPTLTPGRRWQKCPYLVKSAWGKYHCFSKDVYPSKCFHGCKAYYPRPRKSST